MNVINNPDQGALIRHDNRRHAEGDLDFDQIFKAARRQIWLIFAFCAIGVAGGFAYVAQSVPRYTATSVLLIDSTKNSSAVSASIADLTYDSGAIDSQLEVLKSEGTASSVMNSLKLEGNAEFQHPPVSLLSRWSGALRGLLHGGSEADDAGGTEAEKARRARRATLDQLESSLGVRRVGRSYVINVDYTSTDPDLAATIANGFAQAYVGDQIAAKLNALQQTKEWLEKRAAEFKTKWIESDFALQKQRAKLGVITSDGKPLGNQQLVQLGVQLTTAQSETARAVARYGQLQSLIASNNIDSDIPDTLSNPTIIQLRATYRRIAQIAAASDPTEPQTAALRQALDGYRSQILTEMSRILQSYRSDADVARAKEDSLRKSIADLAQKNTADDQQLVAVQVMDGEVSSNRKIYEGLLQRYQDVQERQTFPEAEAQIITRAAPPTAPAYPKRPLVTALSLLLGALAGIGVAAVRENRDRVFRTASDARSNLHLDFLGMLPTIRTPRATIVDPIAREPGHIQNDNPLLRFSVDHPFSAYSETLQSVKVAADLRLDAGISKVLGVISVAPNEGKTTFAKNLASLMGRMGASVLLIDGDLHQRGLTTALANSAEYGLLEVLQGSAKLDDCLLTETESGLAFLPTVIKGRMPHSAHILASSKMRDLIADARRTFNYIIVDLPPVGPIVGVRAAASMFDGFVVIVEWGRTVQAMVRNAVLGDNEIASKCVGVVYNRVNMSKIKLYEGLGSNAFHHEEFGDYLKTGMIIGSHQ